MLAHELRLRSLQRLTSALHLHQSPGQEAPVIPQCPVTVLWRRCAMQSLTTEPCTNCARLRSALTVYAWPAQPALVLCCLSLGSS